MKTHRGEIFMTHAFLILKSRRSGLLWNLKQDKSCRVWRAAYKFYGRVPLEFFFVLGPNW